MAKSLSTKAQLQLTRKDIIKSYDVYINDVVNNDVMSFSQDFSYDFGIAAFSVEFLNDGGKYSKNGSNEIKLGDKIVFKERFYATGSDEFTNFTGYVRQREKSRSSKSNTIVLTCLDYLCKLDETDIDHKFEATKVQVIDETLTPSYLPAPNASMAIIFNFAHEALASEPPITIVIKDTRTNLEYMQSDGFEINYATGQITLGSAVNALQNYSIICKSYYFYPIGLYIEDILEDIITEPDGFGDYLFSEASAQAVIDNHLTETFLNIEGRSIDTLLPNYSTVTKTVRTNLTIACSAGATSITVNDTTSFPSSGTGDVNGDVFTWTAKTPTTLTGIPSSGSDALKAHPVGAYVQYDYSCVAGRVWYTTYSNILTTLTSSNFTIPAGRTISHIDHHNGYIILDAAVSTSSTITCNISYSFNTLQASGIEINKMEYAEREIDNRLEAVKKLREYTSPNYLIQTIGTDKIWARYVKQKTTEDYTLYLKTKMDHAEDTDIYTHTKFFGKSANPKNVCLNEDTTINATDQTYNVTVNDQELTYSSDEGEYRVYKTGLSAGKIVTDTVMPVVRINGVVIDNQPHEMIMQPVYVQVTTRTTYEQSKGK